MRHVDFVNEVLAELGTGALTLKAVESTLYLKLHDIDLVEACHDLIPADTDSRANALKRFIACKMVEGCTQKTITYYSDTLKRFMLRMPKPIEQITIDDIRYYIAVRSMQDKVTKATQDNELRILKSFFGWASANGVTSGDPARGIKCIKAEKRESDQVSRIGKRIKKRTSEGGGAADGESVIRQLTKQALRGRKGLKV